MTEMVTVRLFDATRYEGVGWPPDDLVGAIAWMQAYLDAIPEEFRASASFEMTPRLEYGDPTIALEVSYQRPETADEEADRIARQTRARAHSEAQERQRYEALKAKFG